MNIMKYLEPAQRESLTSRLNQVQASLSFSIGREGKDTFISGFLLSVLGLRHSYLKLGEVPGLHEKKNLGNFPQYQLRFPVCRGSFMSLCHLRTIYHFLLSPLAPSLLLSPEPCISHRLTILSEAQNILGTGNLREAHCGHRLAEHRASI